MSTTIDLDQVQSLVLRGYRVLEAEPFQQYVYVSLSEPAAARAWLADVVPLVTTCARFDAQVGPWTLCVGMTYRGLLTLGFPTDVTLSPAFTAGMAARAELLGDVGTSAPQRWEAGLGGATVHALVSISGADLESVVAGRRALEATLRPGVAIVGSQDAAHLPDLPAGTEHFGFVDGIGQPYVEGSGLRAWPGEGSPAQHGWTPIKAGEFVLGYEGEVGSRSIDAPAIVKNGSYFVLRKLQQHVAEFREYVAEIGKVYRQSPELVAAKMVGRWQSGAPLSLAPDRDDAELAADPSRNNDFRYHGDPHGYRCPIGAHVRRANPRDDKTGPTIRQVRLHRIIRRALPYGPWLPAGQRDDVDRGVMFGVVNSDLVDQFEYVQLNWINDTISSRSLSIGIDRDPIAGAQSGHGKMLVQHPERPWFCWDLPRFVDVRGGDYFLVPAIATLQQLAGVAS